MESCVPDPKFGVMLPAKSYTDLIVWQSAHHFVIAVYAFTTKFPRKKEVYGLTSQFRPAAASIAANIVEGDKKQVQGTYFDS